MAKSPTKFFLDSNVILSGIISDKGSPRIILDLLSLRLPKKRRMKFMLFLLERG